MDSDSRAAAPLAWTRRVKFAQTRSLASVLLRASSLTGRTVAVTGVAGGVGRFAIQLAHLAGAKVTAVVGRSERANGLDLLGADNVSIGMDQLVPGFDLILESAGGESLGQAFWLVGPGGTIVSFGNSARTETRFSISDFYPKQAVLRGYYVLEEVVTDPPADDLEHLMRLFADGDIRADIATVVDWRDARTALADLRERCLAGKAVLRVTAADP